MDRSGRSSGAEEPSLRLLGVGVAGIVVLLVVNACSASSLLVSEEPEMSRNFASAAIGVNVAAGLLLIATAYLAVRKQLAAASWARSAHARLRDSEARLRAFVTHAPAAIAMFDRDMRYLSASRRWCSDYLLGERPVEGLSHYEVFPEIGEAWKDVHRRALSGEVVSKAADRFERADGTTQTLRWEVRPWCDDAGAIGGIVIFTEDLTEVTRAAEEARELAEWLRVAQVAAHAGTWQWNVRTGECVWSDELWRLYGLAKHAVLPSYEAWRDVLLAEDREAAERSTRAAASQGWEINLTFRVRWPDGSVHHLLSRGAPLFDGEGRLEKYVGIVLDDTDRKLSEEALHESRRRRALEEQSASAKERYGQLLDAAPDAMIVVDQDARIQLLNVQAEKLFGYARDELLGRGLDTLIPARFRTPHAAHVTDFFRRPSPRAMGTGRELVGLRKDGVEICIEVSLGLLRTGEGLTVSAAIRDISERKRAEAELRQARLLAEAGSAAKTEFLSSMSHELRTPLNAVLGFAQLLRRDKKEPLSGRHRERVDQIIQGGEHLLRLIDDILDLSRIESGRVSISQEAVCIADVLGEVRRTLEPLVARNNVRLLTPSIESGGQFVTADRTRFAQILMNLGSNAIKYNRPGGQVVFAMSHPAEGRVRISVRDTGLGIPRAKQQLLFQPFQRIGQETGPIEGTGIGLVITRRLAQLMNADIGFDSVEGEGSEFWIDLPAAEAPAAAPKPARMPELGGTAANDSATRSILYIEDNPANVAVVQDFVAGLGNVEFRTEPTAERGVAVALERTPDVVLLDLNLAGAMTGLDALEALRANPKTHGIPVIAVTASASERDKAKGELAGFDRYLTKPLDVDQLDATLAAFLSTSTP